MTKDSKGHLFQLDLVRTFTVLGVISVHSTWFTNNSQNFWANAAMDALHYTREAFLFMTAFVLIYTYYHRPLNLSRFWGKRFRLIGIPYVVWSILYLLYGGGAAHGVVAYVKTLGWDLITGTAWFHLYYLLVTMQIYLAFPIMVWLLKKTRRYHKVVLTLALVLEVVMMAAMQYFPHQMIAAAPGFLSVLIRFRGQVFFTYEFYLVLGALAAIHFEQIHAWVVGHGRIIGSGLVLSLAVLWGIYGVGVLVAHQTVAFASGVLQPMIVPFSAFMIAGLYWLGTRWAENRNQWGWFSDLIILGSELSFGIYLIHPWVLQQISTYVVPLFGNLSRAIVTPGTVLLTFSLSMILVRIIAATPLSVYVIGRESMPWPTWLKFLVAPRMKGEVEAYEPR